MKFVPFEEGGMEPLKLKPKRWKYTVDTVTEHIRKGHRREQAFIRAGISAGTMYTWLRKYKEEVEEGFTDTALIRFWTIVLEAEAEAEADIVEILRNNAMSGNIKACMYLLDKRYGYSTKQEVELSTKEDNKISIEITNMVEGDSDAKVESGDDSNSTEIHQ